jgi:AraC family transcriptional regulator
MGTATPFTLDQTHGIVTLPSSYVRASSADLGWTSLLISAQHEEPFEAEVEPVRDHLIVLHLGGPVRVNGSVDTKSVRKLVPPGGIFLWPAGSGFHVGLEEAVDTLHLYIRSSVVEEVADSLGYTGNNAARLLPRLCETDHLLEQLALEVRRAANSVTSPSLYVDHLALAIAARLVHHNAAGPPVEGALRSRGLTSSQLRRVEEYIEENLGNTIQLQELSSASDLSVSHFVRQFRLTTGVSPHQFILRRRVERARRLLTHTEDAVVEIALSCGFSHQEHLTHTFRRFTGTTPASYRRTIRN